MDRGRRCPDGESKAGECYKVTRTVMSALPRNRSDPETARAASEDLRPNAAIGHRLATVQCGVECLELLFESMLGTVERTDDEPVIGDSTLTGWPTTRRAARATRAGVRTARLLPHAWPVRFALPVMTGLPVSAFYTSVCIMAPAGDIRRKGDSLTALCRTGLLLVLVFSGAAMAAELRAGPHD